MSTEPDFPRQHPQLDKALREQIKAPVLDAAFRKQVMARVAAQREELARVAAAPASFRGQLRIQLLLQLANISAIAIAAVLLIKVAMPWLGSLTNAAWLNNDSALPLYMTVGGVVLLYGLKHVRLPGWVRGLGI
jgi:hypothetical protein